ncbi:four helix bundle protein [Virgibacillus sp. C22-A2]|uniref:Four helix bundle protein n=1 Tax=Virgibacillus tibetensis TaxID=3042313 RepID=A0ABU6KGK2_9BACI|nr:four helix bundle protein [Virgibacillus sp. C22-A2]
MNQVVEQIQGWYRNERELSNYSIMDVGDKLKYLAEKGLIWILKDMKDNTEFEKIVIDSFLNKYRANQVYDNLNAHFDLKPSNQTPQPNSYEIPQKDLHFQDKKQQFLEIRDVKKFSGYQKAKELEEKIFDLCRNFPSYEYNIVDQIGRSANSIKKSIEIAEQIYVREKFKNYSDAIGSAKETSAWLEISVKQQYISQNQFEELDNLVKQVVSILTRTMSNIIKKEGEEKELPNPYTPDVRNFTAYEEALILVEKVYEMTSVQEFRKEKDIVYRMRKYATSCVANIAEAHQLYILKKFSFFNEALMALSRVDSLLQTCLTRQIVTEKAITEIKKLIVTIRKILLKTMGNMSKQK